MSDLERNVLEEKIHNTINFGEDSPGFLLRLFTKLPVFSIELWNELRPLDGVVFRDLHIGLDISESYFNADPAKNSPSVFIEQRQSDRKILNIDELVQVSSDLGHSTAFGSLSSLPFRHQLELFASIDVLVAVAGTALHNVLFMRPGSAVIMFMQPEWCELAWMYANQAILLNIQPFVHCAPSAPPVAPANTMPVNEDGKIGSNTMDASDPGVFKHYQWSRQFWLQGPRHHKTDDIFVDPTVFSSLLQKAIEYVSSHKARENANDTDTPTAPLDCPGYTLQRSKRTSAETNNAHSYQQAAPANAQIQRMVEIYISSVNVAVAADQNSWDVAIVGEIGAARDNLAGIMRTMPHLSFCVETDDNPAWCHPVAGFNYYSNLTMNMVLPRQNLHFWAQTSSTGGKIRHSDVFLAIDCRLPDAGFAVHAAAMGVKVHFEVDIYEHCVESGTKTKHAQVLRYPSHKLAPLPAQLTCGHSRRVTFKHHLESRLSLQRFTADFCSMHALTRDNCGKFIFELQKHLRRILNAAQLGLPEVQSNPSEPNPFFFMHIEKTAGSTLREYIFESLQEPNKTSFIPCYTTHCRVFALPQHSLMEYTSDTTVNLNQVSLTDLRLIQPLPTDISKITVFAGHLDFYALVLHLPQCRSIASSRDKFVSPVPSTWSPHILSRVDPLHPVVPPSPVATPSCRVSCFTMGRHPVDRAISYYYQRFYQYPEDSPERTDAAEAVSFGGRPLHMRRMNELTVAQLRNIAVGAREGLESPFFPGEQVIVDEGMSDAACRAVLGLKYTTGLRMGPMSAPAPIPASLYPRAVENLHQCVVGIQEHWNDTLRVLDHWLPWIDFAAYPNQRRMSIYSGLETRHTLRSELFQLLVQANPCDMMLFEEMLRIFQAQLSVLNDSH
eukprot:gene13123-15128_t